MIEPNFDRWSAKLWLWKNGDHFLAFDSPRPTFDGGDPKTLGEPFGYALLEADTYERLFNHLPPQSGSGGLWRRFVAWLNEEKPFP